MAKGVSSAGKWRSWERLYDKSGYPHKREYPGWGSQLISLCVQLLQRCWSARTFEASKPAC